jgi:hypothetical protein
MNLTEFRNIFGAKGLVMMEFPFDDGGRLILVFPDGMSEKHRVAIQSLPRVLSSPTERFSYLYGQVVVNFDKQDQLIGYSWMDEGGSVGDLSFLRSCPPLQILGAGAGG